MPEDRPTERDAQSCGDLPEEILRSVLALIDAPRDERARRVDELCAAHPEHADAIRFLLSALEDSRPPPAGRGFGPERIGPFRVIGYLGSGNMGTVYLAQRSDPFQLVAVKVVQEKDDPARVLARFEAEKQALALMNHENIARVFETGQTDDGLPFFVMEYVRGVSITRYCDDSKLPITDRLQLFQQVCAGVHHAHQKGIIHRDLKPSNILVTTASGRAVPKIIDFGLARATDYELIELRISETHRIVGTPLYMSPEQAQPSALDVDTRTDIYSLGVVLYEMLAGELPFTEEQLLAAGVEGMFRIIREDDPPKPSARLTTSTGTGEAVARTRRVDLRRLLRTLRDDLDWIVMRSLEKDRTRRYSSAEAFAEDIGRHLRHEPVDAGPPSAGYRVRKFARRYRGQVAAAGTVLAILLVSSAAVSWSLVEASQSLDRFNLLAVGTRLQIARDVAAAIHPPWPDNIQALEAWEREHGGKLERDIETVDLALDELRPRALPWTAAEKDADRRRARDEGRAFERRTWRFPTEGEGFLFDALTRLRAELGAFAGPDGELEDVRARLAWAREIEQRSVGDHRSPWDMAIAAIRADDRFGGLDLPEQIGLVPLGANGAGYQEFAHLRSGARGRELPARDPASGRFVVTEDTGIVFVLLPGGPFTMGRRADPGVTDIEGKDGGFELPQTSGRLDAFFVSKYEVTHAQWRRLSGAEPPSNWIVQQPAVVDATHPVEMLTWHECDRVLTRHGLSLPTEMQWEYAARGGTSTPWSFGADPQVLRRHGNVADVAYTRSSWVTVAWKTAAWDDGHGVHAPVGSYDSNPFGLHDVHGNVSEWCKDGWDPTCRLPVRDGDGLREVEAPSERVHRSGSFYTPPYYARSAYRSRHLPDQTGDSIGVRPARRVLPRNTDPAR